MRASLNGRTRRRWLATGLALLVAGIMPAAGRAAASGWVGDAHAAVRLISATEAVGSAAQIDAGIEIRLAPGWHAYWRSPGDAGVAPTVDWKGSRNLKSATLAWPAPRRFSTQGLQTAVYDNRIVLPVAVALAQPGQPLLLHAEVDYAACAEICIPYHADLTLDLPAGTAVPGPEAQLIADAEARVPVRAAAAGIALRGLSVAGTPRKPLLRLVVASPGRRFSAPDLFVEGIDGASFGRPRAVLSEGGREAALTVQVAGVTRAALIGRRLILTLTDGRRAAELSAVARAASATGAAGRLPVAVLVAALLGGLILNVMPCVLPVLSLKLLAVIGYAGAARRRLRTGFIATALGILASFLLLAATLILLRAGGAAIGWGIQFQQPWFLVAMIALLSLFAASLWDWLAIGLPGAAYRLGAVEADNPWAGAFLTGVFATLLATPCSAPFVGTAIGFALARGPIEIVAIFAVLGLGFALPYLLVAVFPGVVRLLPRPGRWMLVARRLLGAALVATAVWLATVLAVESGTVAALATAGLMVALLAALAWRSRLAGGGARRALGGAAAVLVGLALVVPMLAGRGRAEATAAGAAWRPFDEAELHRLVAKGDVVFVDVTADWCLTCKVNKAAVIDRDPVAARLLRPGTVAMRADWTRANPTVAAYLAGFGRYGIPFDAVYGPGAKTGIALPELLTSAAVTSALAAAARPADVADQRAERRP